MANQPAVAMPNHAPAISAKNSGLCVTPAARLRLAFQVPPLPTEWSTGAGATSTARRTMVAGVTRNRWIELHSSIEPFA